MQKGNQAILNYFEELTKAKAANEVDHLYEAKLLILGEGGSGKTTLFRKLQDITNPPPTDKESTEGIDIHELYFPCKNGKQFRINLWDFGGQEIYHVTHQFFLTKRSLYILVTDGRAENTDFNYWLRTIELWSDNSPLIILENVKHSRKQEIDLRGIQNRFTNIINPVRYVDLKEDMDGVQKLKEAIEFHIERLDHIGSELPRIWTKIRAKLEEIGEEEPYITEAQYYKVCKELGMPEHDRAKYLSQFLHDLGVFLHFQKDEELHKTVILQNDWATDGVYRVLDDAKVKANHGRFTFEDASAIWKEESYQLMRGELLALMRKFELCYHVKDTADPKVYIAPQLLPVEQPVYDWDGQENLELRFQYEFMPKGIVGRFIVRKNQYIKDVMKEAWRSGVVLHRGDTKAEIVETYGNAFLRIRVTGPEPRILMTIIKDEMDAIHQTYPNLKVRAEIPCICDTCEQLKKTGKDPHFYPYQNLLERKRAHKETVECDNSPFHDVSVTALIDAIFTATSPNPEDDPYETLPQSQSHIANDANIHGNSNIIVQNTKGDIHIHQHIDNRSIHNQLAPLKQLVEDEQQATKDWIEQGGLEQAGELLNLI